MQELWEYIDANYHEEGFNLYDAKEISLEKEKEQIVKAWEDGDYAYFYSKETGRDFDNGEEYYKDVYSTKEVNDDKYSIFDCYGMIVEHYGINMTFEKAKNLIDKLNPIGDGFAPYTIEKNNQNK